ncbi:hypothetical protein [Pontibacillus litoralis]|uniref:Uncharacterized protein n=1 Tax=Pontibacillus litoralis JSM 072002 TaxID=1385512 RepID=A0A0A5G2R4_9BACI|nr:hypothetical protein [Pontibacillus litoralis]KGX86334.1 hypothetical protein N784_05130 [Pontibacillus litoralis JSM 072002]
MVMLLNIIFFICTLALTKYCQSSILMKLFYWVALIVSLIGIVFLIFMSGWVAYTGGVITAGISLLGLLGIVYNLLKE